MHNVVISTLYTMHVAAQPISNFEYFTAPSYNVTWNIKIKSIWKTLKLLRLASLQLTSHYDIFILYQNIVTFYLHSI